VQVDPRPWEVGEPTGVVEVQVGHDDVAHVLGPEAEPPHLRVRGLFGVEARAQDAAHERGERCGVAAVAEPEPRVDEHEPLRVLDEQAVRDHVAALEDAALARDQAAGDGAHRGAVEVVDDDHAASSHDLGAPSRRRPRDGPPLGGVRTARARSLTLHP
jgi:hypothetical protein